MRNEPEQSEGKSVLLTKLELGVVLSLIVSAGSVVFSAGIVWTTVQVHDREIIALKVKDQENTDRLARIETKLDLVLGDKAREVP